jgi:hypothetical protein
VDQRGRITGRSAGFAKITATSGGAFGRVGVIVVPPSVRTLIIPAGDDDAGHTLPAELAQASSFTTGTAVRQRNIGVLVGIGGAVLAAIALVILFKGPPAGSTLTPVQNPPASATGPITPTPATGPTTGATGGTGIVAPATPTGASGNRGGTVDSSRRRRGDSAGSKRTRLDSAQAERCRKLRERWSVGDSLTVAEDRMLKGLCAR